LFLRFMYAMTALSLALNVLELHLLLSKWIRRTCCNSKNNQGPVDANDRLPMEAIVIDRLVKQYFQTAVVEETATSFLFALKHLIFLDKSFSDRNLI